MRLKNNEKSPPLGGFFLSDVIFTARESACGAWTCVSFLRGRKQKNTPNGRFRSACFLSFSLRLDPLAIARGGKAGGVFEGAGKIVDRRVGKCV